MKYLSRGILIFIAIADMIFAGNKLISYEKIVEPPRVLLPYRIYGTSIIVERIWPYSGLNFELDSNEEICNVAAIRLRNVGPDVIRSLVVNVQTTNNAYRFEATFIPPDSSVIVLNMDGSVWKEEEIVSCTGNCSYGKRNQYVDLRIRGQGQYICNFTGSIQENISFYSRQWSEDYKAFLGASAYKKEIARLKPMNEWEFCPSEEKQNMKVIWIE